MTQQRQHTEHKTFAHPDETRSFPHGRAEILNIGNGTVGRLVFEPGWRWSNDLKPIVQTDSCHAPHFQYHVSGRLAIRMDDGATRNFTYSQKPTVNEGERVKLVDGGKRLALLAN